MEALDGQPGLVRLIYSSQSNVPKEQLSQELSAILARSRQENARRMISGILLAVVDSFVQLLEGPEACIDQLLEEIAGDPRHRELRVHSRTPVQTRLFPQWSMACIDRSVPIDPAAWSLEIGRTAATAFDGWASGMFKALCLPSVQPDHSMGHDSGESLVQHTALIVSPSRIWGPAFLNALATESEAEILRTSVRAPASSERTALLEYADLTWDLARSVRAVALTSDEPDRELLHAIIERPSLIVVLLASSDAATILEGGWAALSPLQSIYDDVPYLFVCNASPPVLERLNALLCSRLGDRFTMLSCSVRDTAKIWAEVKQRLSRQALGRNVNAAGDHVLPGTLSSAAASTEVSNKIPLERLLNRIEGALWAMVVNGACELVEFNGRSPSDSVQDCHASVSAIWPMVTWIRGFDRIEDIAVYSSARMQCIRSFGDTDALLIMELDRDGDTLATVRVKCDEFVQSLRDGNPAGSTRLEASPRTPVN